MDKLTNKQKSVVNFLINMGYRKSDVSTVCHKANYELVTSHKLLSSMRRNGKEGVNGGRSKVNEEIMKKLSRKGFSRKESMIATRKGKGDFSTALKYAKKARKKKEKKEKEKNQKEKGSKEKIDETRKSSKKGEEKKSKEVKDKKTSKKKEVRERKSSKSKKKKEKKSKDGKKSINQIEIDKLWKEFDSAKRECDIKKLTILQKKFSDVGEDRGITFCVKQTGAIHYKNGENEKAVEYYIQALGTPYMKLKGNESVELERSLLLYTLGLLLFKMGRKEESDKYLRQIKDKKRFMKTLKGIKKGQSVKPSSSSSKKDSSSEKSKKSKKSKKSIKSSKKTSKKAAAASKEEVKKQESSSVPVPVPKKEGKEEEEDIKKKKKEESEKMEEKKKKKKIKTLKKKNEKTMSVGDDDVFELSSDDESSSDEGAFGEGSSSSKSSGDDDNSDVFQLSDEDDEDLEMYEQAINTPVKNVQELEYKKGEGRSPAFDVTPYTTPVQDEMPDTDPSDPSDNEQEEEGQDDNEKEKEVTKVLYSGNDDDDDNGNSKVEVIDELDDSSSLTDDFDEGLSEENEDTKKSDEQKQQQEEEEEEVIFDSDPTPETTKKPLEDQEEAAKKFMSPPKKKSEVFRVGNEQLEKESSRMEAEFFGDDNNNSNDSAPPVAEVADSASAVGSGSPLTAPQPVEATMEELDIDEDFDFPDDTQIMSFEDRQIESVVKTPNVDEVVKTPNMDNNNGSEDDFDEDSLESDTEEEEERKVVDLLSKSKKNQKKKTKKKKEEPEPESEEEMVKVDDIGIMDSDTDEMDTKKEKKLKKKERKRIIGTIEKRRSEFKKLQKTYTIPNYIYLKHILEEIGALWKDLERFEGEGSKKEEVHTNLVRKAQILTNLGTISFQKKNFVMSVQYFIEAVEYKKKIGDLKNIHIPLNNVGKIFFAQREYGKSLKYFEEAYAVNPEYPGVLEYLAKSALKTGKFGRAREVLEIFKKTAESSLKSKNMCWAYRKLGVVLAKLGKWEDSLKFYRKSIGLVEKEKVRDRIMTNIQRLEDKIDCL